MTVATLNVSVDQIRSDLRAGKTVDEIAAEWQEPRANVLGVLIELRREATSPAPAPAPAQPAAARPLQPVPAQEAPPAAVDVATVRVVDLVGEASRSSRPALRRLGEKLDKLAEDLAEQLTAARVADQEREAKERERLSAIAEVQRLEAALKAARGKLGGGKRRTSSTKTADNPQGGKSSRPAYPGGPTSSEIRKWAKSAGVDAPGKGTLPTRVIDAYREAHAE